MRVIKLNRRRVNNLQKATIHFMNASNSMELKMKTRYLFIVALLPSYSLATPLIKQCETKVNQVFQAPYKVVSSAHYSDIELNYGIQEAIGDLKEANTLLSIANQHLSQINAMTEENLSKIESYTGSRDVQDIPEYVKRMQNINAAGGISTDEMRKEFLVLKSLLDQESDLLVDSAKATVEQTLLEARVKSTEQKISSLQSNFTEGYKITINDSETSNVTFDCYRLNNSSNEIKIIMVKQDPHQ